MWVVCGQRAQTVFVLSEFQQREGGEWLHSVQAGCASSVGAECEQCVSSVRGRLSAGCKQSAGSDQAGQICLRTDCRGMRAECAARADCGLKASRVPAVWGQKVCGHIARSGFSAEYEQCVCIVWAVCGQCALGQLSAGGGWDCVGRLS